MMILLNSALAKKTHHRLNTIYQTNIATAYAAGRWQRIQHTKTLLPYLQYMPSTSRHKRDDHKAYYGIVRHVDDPIWQKIFPPNGYGCHCSTRSLTQQEAEKIGITDDDTIANLPNVDDGFDHNHDRLSALIRLAKDRHGAGFVKTLENHLSAYIPNIPKQIKIPIKTANFSAINIAENDQEVQRLLVDLLDNKPKLHEAMAGAEYQVYFNVRLERPEPVFDNGNPQAGFDYLIADNGKKLDFMFTMFGYPPKKIEMLNKYFAHTDDAWQRKIKDIQDHLKKADIVPLDLRYLTVENRLKLVSYVVSLPKEQRDKILLIVDR